MLRGNGRGEAQGDGCAGCWRSSPWHRNGRQRGTGLDGLANVVDCPLDATTAFQMVAVTGKCGEQDGLEVLCEQLEHQRVLGFPAFQPLPRSSVHPPYGREAVAGMGAFEVGEQPGFPRLPIPAEVPHGMVGMGGLPGLAQPVIRALHPPGPRHGHRRACGGGDWMWVAEGHRGKVVAHAGSATSSPPLRARWRVGSMTARIAASFSGTPRKAASGGRASSGRWTRSA